MKIYQAGLLATFSMAVLACKPPAATPLYVGTYTQADGSHGIHYLEYDFQNDSLHVVQEYRTPNPSFLAKGNGFLLAVNELTGGEQQLTSLAISEGGLSPINSIPTSTGSPCHVLLAEDESYAIVSNYVGGAVDLFSITGSGQILRREDTRIYTGSSIDKERQRASHIHSAFLGPDGWVYVSDLGADKIYVLEVVRDGDGLSIKERDTLDVPAGGGPRHLAFHPIKNDFYALMELSGEIHRFSLLDQQWTLTETYDLNKDDFSGVNGAADIKISADGKFLYATNRGEANVISTFGIQPDGKLTKKQVLSVGGQGPRNFNFSPDEQFVLIGNQLSDEIVIFHRDVSTGLLEDSGKSIPLAQPVCIIF